MKRKLIVLVLLSLCLPGFSQVTIEDCYRKAGENYPLIRQYDLIEKTKEYNLSNAGKGYLPQVTFSAKASYQSDVTQLPFDPSQLGMQGVNIPTLSKDQYSATVDVNQTLWDGGAIKSRKEGIRATAETGKKNTEVSLYAIRERINQLYFGILLTNAQLRQNELLKEELKRNYDRVESYIQNGIAHQADLDAIRVDMLKTEQNRIQITSTRKAYIEMLSKWTGMEMSPETEFVKPVAERPVSGTIDRPELGWYEAQIKELESRNREITSGLMPRLGLFVTGGYGRPGLNMLEDDFSAYYMAGAKLSWNIGNFYTKKNSRREVEANIQGVETQRATFLFNTGLDVMQKDNRIGMYLGQLKSDDEIIRLRASIKRSSEVQMANGTLSGSDLVRDIHAEQMAIQDKLLHEMELLLSIYDLKFTINH